MKAIIFHGTGCKPGDFWYSWLKTKLEKRGFVVELPYYADMNRKPITDFLSEILKNHVFDPETILIGHSAGVPLILSILENIDTRVAQAALIAGFSEPLDEDGELILQKSYNWEKIKKSANNFLIFNSPDDPWGCDDRQGKKLFDKLGGTLIIRNDGHFGSSKDPDYKEFPLLEHLIGVSV